jgi:hypothetical protein
MDKDFYGIFALIISPIFFSSNKSIKVENGNNVLRVK